MSAARVAVVLLAAGEGRRVGAGRNKVLLPLGGLPVFGWSLRAAQTLAYVVSLVVVVRPDDRDTVRAALAEHFAGTAVAVVTGGDSRHGSEWNALQALAPRIDDGTIEVVAIHDAARPLAGPALFAAVIEAALEHGGALPVREQGALLLRDPAGSSTGAPGAPDSPGGAVAGAPTQTGLVAVQTPQAFRAAPLLAAYRQAGRDGFTGTDTAACVAAYTDVTIACVPGPATNLKVTYPEDVALAARLVGGEIPAG